MADQEIDFVTLGMFIIDDIYPSPTAPSQTPHLNIPGGAGTYSAIGARLFSPPPSSQSVGWIIDAGTDFLNHTLSTIKSWQTGAVIRPRNAPTTRGWNGYSGNDHRAFKYLTEKKRLTADDLDDKLLGSKSFHLICSPQRCIDQVTGILKRRKETFGEDFPRPIFIWEPVPDLCIPEELETTYEALKYVDVVSPNHEETASLFGFTHPDEKVDRGAVEGQAMQLLKSGIGTKHEDWQRGAIVVRAGSEGCFVLTSNAKRWLPAFHQNGTKVVDPTGGGNGFLGGLAIGLVHTYFDVVESARWGSVAASYCIEQVGMPHLDASKKGQDADDETWNGANVLDRLSMFQKRTS